MDLEIGRCNTCAAGQGCGIKRVRGPSRKVGRPPATGKRVHGGLMATSIFKRRTAGRQAERLKGLSLVNAAPPGNQAETENTNINLQHRKKPVCPPIIAVSDLGEGRRCPVIR